MNIASLYVRTSTDRQDSGLQAQEMALVEYVKSKGVGSYKVFRDANQSGGKHSRPALDEMMEQVRSGEFDTVVVYSFSRYARSTKQLLDGLAEFERLNVNFVSITEQIDTSTPMGKLVFTFVSALAEFEKELIRSRVITGLEGARKRGKVLGAPKQINTPLILELFKKGYKYREIAKLAGCSIASVSREVRAVS